MLPCNPAPYSDPLDLLHRFVPTPLKAAYRIGAARVMVQSNDFTLLPLMLSGVHLDDGAGWDWEWKLVRDADSRGLLQEALLVKSQALTVADMGPGCLLGIDHGRHELFAFIGRDVDPRTHQEFLVPFLCRMVNGTSPPEQFEPAGADEEFAHD